MLRKSRIDASGLNRWFRHFEIAIFSLVSLVFFHSAYRLLVNAGGDYVPAETRATAAQALRASRGLAAAIDRRAETVKAVAPQDPEQTGYIPYRTQCKTSGESLQTSAPRIRIVGTPCGLRAPASVPSPASAPLTQSRVENSTTRYVATVFNDPVTREFSTDFIPLDTGTNRIRLEFKYGNGSTHPATLTVVRK